MTSITHWSSITYYTPAAQSDPRDTPDVSALDQDGGGGLEESELAALLEKGPKGASSAPTSGNSGTPSTGWAGMQMDTRSFATMTTQGPPPPPPPSLSKLDSDEDGTITAEEFGVSSTSSNDEDSDDLFSAIDTDDSGDLSAEEFSEFEQKMKTLFSRVQQMGHAEYQSVADAGYQTNDANLNLSA